MKKSFIFIPLVIMVLLIVAAITVIVVGQPNETKIYTASEFDKFVKQEAGTSQSKAVLYADINVNDDYDEYELSGELDGNGHTITVKDTGSCCLFNAINESGSVKNLILCGKEGSTNIQATAGIALRNLGTIENCVVYADFSDSGFVSGICHTNNGNISDCAVWTQTKYEVAVWNPICAENLGTVNGCYYSCAASDNYNIGTFATEDDIKNGVILKQINESVADKAGLVSWAADDKGYPTLKADKSNSAASVFSGGIGIFLVCIIILIIAVPIFTIIYADKQKKQVYQSKA